MMPQKLYSLGLIQQIRKMKNHKFQSLVTITLLIWYIPFTYAITEAEKDTVFIGKTKLPDQVQHLNSIENYMVGNGIVCASGMGNGEWDFIAGPDYTCPNLIHNEKLSIVIDGIEFLLQPEMFRIRETGNFSGITQIGDIKITMLDYSVPGTSILSRLVFVHNTAAKNHTLELKAYLTPIVNKGRKDLVVRTGNGSPSAALFQVDTTLFCMYGDNSNWVKNWVDRYLLIAWSGGQSNAQKSGRIYQIKSGTKTICANTSESFNLFHYAYYKNKADSENLKELVSRNALADAEQSITEWQHWFRNVPDAYNLNKITDQRARDIVEGGLYVIKTNQTRDGGIVANEKTYDLSWTRDAYCGLRGLLACGHTTELKQFITYMDGVYKAYGFIPNAASVGRNTFALYNGNYVNNPNRNLGQFSPCPEANTAPETPALLVLVARDYYHATKDIQTTVDAGVTLRYSMDIQLKHAIANKYKLEFAGDETEFCGAVSTDSAGYDRHLDKLWSMSSIALCNASLEFYIEFLMVRGENPSKYKNSLDSRILDLNSELNKLNKAFENDFWRTDLKLHPEGFYDWGRIKSNNSFPNGRIVNYSLFPVYYKMKPNVPKRFDATVLAMKTYFKASNKTLPLVPIISDERYLGHNLGYLLWCLVEIDDTSKYKIYDALVNGNSAQCWGSYNEGYDADGTPNNNNLRTFETGVNIDAIAKYWNFGNNPMTIPVQRVRLGKDVLAIEGTESVALSAEIMPLNVSNKTLRWVSSNPDIVKVSGAVSATATGVKPGNCSIVATSLDNSKIADSITIEVLYKPAKGMSVFPNSTMVGIACMRQLKAEVFPATASNKNISWTSSDTSIAKVNSIGRATGISMGSVFIKCVSEDGAYKDSCKLVVTIPGNGLKGDYYNNMNLSGNIAVIRTDPNIDFLYDLNSYSEGQAVDSFSVRWTGQVVPLFTETYTFETACDDGTRLWVNDTLLIDNWVDQGETKKTGKVDLTAGMKYNIKMEYYENTYGASAHLRWSSPSQAYVIIPQEQLYSIH
jgi:hypothetical protein